MIMHHHRHHHPVTGAGIEFRPHLIGDDDESDVTSPPLWKTSSTTTPTETTSVLDHDRLRCSSTSHRYDPDHHNQQLQQEQCYYLEDVVYSPTSRIKAISRGQQELMEMVKTMPESAYELSLQDLVQSTSSSAAVLEADIHELHYNQKRRNNDHRTSTTKKKKSTNKKVERLRKSTSMESTKNGSFLLKMFFPTSSLGYQKNKKKKNKSSIVTTTTTAISTCTHSKVSPRPPLVVEGDTSIVEKENWWRKKFSVSSRESISNNGGSGRMDGNSSSSSSRSSSRSFSRNMGDFISGCWSTETKRKKTKSKEQKG